jgi:DNA-binding CsgD family transcriptional regulator
MNPVANDILAHYGVKRRSGRYPWGSGDNPFQRSGDFVSRVEELTRQGLNERERARALGMSTTELRMQLRVASHERRRLEVDRAKSLRADGKSLNEIAQIMGYKNDSSIRSLLNEATSANKNKAQVTADILRKELETKHMIDIGAGVERTLGVSRNTLDEARFILETEGYHLYGIGIPQVTNPGKQTITPVLCDPGIEWKQVYDNMGDIKMVGDYHSDDGGDSYDKREYPASVDSERVAIRYGDEGGAGKDGVIELRRGVDDLDLGNSHYAQVRILVDGDRYLKGMAMYSDDMPDGVDIIFNTNKKSGTDKMDVMKQTKDDPDNPFGAYIKADGQSYYVDEDGNKKLSAINKLKEEGDWDSMGKNLSSQFLSKQPIQLIQKQLNLAYSDAVSEYDEIASLTNPTVKKKLLLEFADECEGAAVHLKAAALPRQKTQVILPITDLGDGEIYAPNYINGERVALVRYPHGGTFEIPILTVNNKNRSAISILGNVTDAVGVNPKVAERLSGADFDGDQVVVIPVNNKVKITSTPALKGLENFNAKDSYAYRDGMKVMSKGATQKQMGVVSNLITDMTLKGALSDELARAVRHSMVVIDANKHKLDYKQSEKDNGISALANKYQGYVGEDGKPVGGASTLLSRRKQDVRIPETRGSGVIDPATGKITYKESGRIYTDPKTGQTTPAMSKVKLLIKTDDVSKLSSGTSQENAYADYANKMKALANDARKEYKSTGKIDHSASAKAAYQTEVDTLNAKLNVSAMNAPRERNAQAIANATVKAKIQDNPDLKNDKAAKKKVGQQAIYDARNAVGASSKNARITITDREWEAIQAGAIAETKLSQILRYADPDEVKQRATPRTSTQLSSAKISKINAMLASGYNNAEIADALNVSTSTVSKYAKS